MCELLAVYMFDMIIIIVSSNVK